MRGALLIAALGIAGCASSEQLVRNRAAVDLACPAVSLEPERSRPGTESLAGCGHSATYVADREGWRLDQLDGKPTPQSSGVELAPLHRAVPPR